MNDAEPETNTLPNSRFCPNEEVLTADVMENLDQPPTASEEATAAYYQLLSMMLQLTPGAERDRHTLAMVQAEVDYLWPSPSRRDAPRRPETLGERIRRAKRKARRAPPEQPPPHTATPTKAPQKDDAEKREEVIKDIVALLEKLELKRQRHSVAKDDPERNNQEAREGLSATGTGEAFQQSDGPPSEPILAGAGECDDGAPLSDAGVSAGNRDTHQAPALQMQIAAEPEGPSAATALGAGDRPPSEEERFTFEPDWPPEIKAALQPWPEGENLKSYFHDLTIYSNLWKPQTLAEWSEVKKYVDGQRARARDYQAELAANGGKSNYEVDLERRIARGERVIIFA